jgi:hypothetical protein
MGTDYVVILGQRRHFGDEQDLFGNAPFVDPDDGVFEGEFTFLCPNIDRGQTAVLMFQARDVDHERNIFRINERTVFGGLPKSPAREDAEDSGWNSHVLLVDPVRHSLEETTNNRLRIESRDSDGGTTGNRDDFVVDNIVLFYKTRSSPGVIDVSPV